MRYFFYGTLMDGFVRRAVLHRELPPASLRRAVLSGFRRVYRRNATYPVLVPQPGGQVDGLLACGLNAGDAGRLAAYEGPEYGLDRIDVSIGDGASVEARIFLPRRSGLGSRQDWHFELWQRRFAPSHRARVARWRQASRPG